jgi:hypothetical protein
MWICTCHDHQIRDGPAVKEAKKRRISMMKIKSAAWRGTGKLARLAHSPSVLVKGMMAAVVTQQHAPTGWMQRFGIHSGPIDDYGGGGVADG